MAIGAAMAAVVTDNDTSQAHVGELSTVASLLGLVALGYYAFIWSLCVLGLRQARALFGAPPSSSPSPWQDRRATPVLPLRQTATPLSPPPPPSASRVEETGVSILRPLAGLDHNLASNLASAFEQRYPKHLFEVILSVRDEADQALPVARRICARYADVQSRIIVGDEPCGVNPKICNLVRPYAAAHFDFVWVLDAQVQVSPYALRRAVEAMEGQARTPSPQVLQREPHGGRDGRVGLCHHVPLGVTPHSTSLGSHVEAIFLSTNHAKMYLAINALSVDSCVMGKSNLFRKSDLACVPDTFFNVSAEGTRGEQGAIGSIAFQQPTEERSGEGDEGDAKGTTVANGPARPLARFGIFLAEDNMLALSLWRAPLNLAHTLIAGDVARTSVGEVKSIGDYWKRRVRWIRVRRHMVPAATYIEPFTESLVCGAIATTAFMHCWLPWLGIAAPGAGNDAAGNLGRNLLGGCFFFFHLLIWHTIDFAVLASVQSAGQHDGSSSSRSTAASSPLVDFDDARAVLTFRLAWLVREMLALPIWCAALCGNTVTWRARKYRILSDARAAYVDAPQSRARWWTGGQSNTSGQRTARGRYERLSDAEDDP